MATSNRTSMTVRGLGSWRGGPLELGNASRLIVDAATCHAVERRDTKIVPVPRTRRVDMTPSKVMVTRSPRHEAIGGAMLSEDSISQDIEMLGTCHAPGLRPNFRQRTTRKHMNEPSRTAERQAADMAEDV